MKPSLRSAILLFACFILSAAWPEISYKVTPEAEKGMLHVTVEIPARGSSTSVQIPNWSPGAYILTNLRNNIKEFSAGTMAVTRPDDNTWKIENGSAKNVVISYDVPNTMNSGAMHYSGPATYVYVVGRKEEACKLTLDTPSDWLIATGLDEVKGSKNTYTAPNYDVLADNPVTMGEFRMLSYSVMGKPHYIAMRGAARNLVDGATIKKQCKFVSMALTDFFGLAPYNKYVWQFDVGDRADGAGGLEHLSSTQISLPSGLGPRSFSVLAHEFFHLWNVKRIRSKQLGPFDYLQLPKTGALWFLEGTTDYYASLLPLRYGWNGEDKFYSDIIGNVDALRRNPARLEVSPNEASMRVGETNNGRGNSNGYKISYYTLGWLAGMTLDLEMRAQTKGKRSLDDVMRALYEMCKDGKPGFAEDEIRKQVIRFAGPAMGPFYDQVIMKPGEMPIEAELAKVGLQLGSKEQQFAERGFTWVPSASDGAPKILRVFAPAEGVLMPDDLLLKVDGIGVTGKSNRDINRMANEQLGKAQIGQKMTLTIKRADKEMDIQITPVAASRSVPTLTEVSGATPQMRELRKGWFYAGKKPIILP